MVLAGLHRGFFAVQLRSLVHGCSQAVLVDKLANILHPMTAEIDVVVAEVRNRKAVLEGQAVEKFGHDHGLIVWLVNN